MIKQNVHHLVLLIMTLMTNQIVAQPFYFGADLSYVNEMEDCGAVYRVNGESLDPYAIFNSNGCNLVRLRLWHTPAWHDQLNNGQRYSDFNDVRLSIIRAKSEGMNVLLDFHLSDTWADPAHQVAPIAWSGVLNNLPVLQDSLYNYIYHTLEKLADENLLPEMVQIGNETNKGILQSQQSNDAGWSLNWPRNKALFNTAIDAVRDIESTYAAEIKVALHVANPDDADWLLEQFWSNDVRDFDIIGLSYYYNWHQVLISFVGERITYLKDLYPGKEVMILETAYPWTNSNADGANNVLGSGYPGFTPPTPAKQLEWMIALTQEVIDHGGKGIVYWEPAWVSTDCFTQWAKGSHWDNATFFDFSKELYPDGGIGWMSYPYDLPVATEDHLPQINQIDFIHAGNEIILRQKNHAVLQDVITIKMYGIDGRAILERSINPDWIDNSCHISLPYLAAGYYSISISSKDQILISKLIFQK